MNHSCGVLEQTPVLGIGTNFLDTDLGFMYRLVDIETNGGDDAYAVLRLVDDEADAPVWQNIRLREHDRIFGFVEVVT